MRNSILLAHCVLLSIVSCSNRGEQLRQQFYRTSTQWHKGVDLGFFEEVWLFESKSIKGKELFDDHAYHFAVKTELQKNKPPFIWLQRAYENMEDPGNVFIILGYFFTSCDPLEKKNIQSFLFLNKVAISLSCQSSFNTEISIAHKSGFKVDTTLFEDLRDYKNSSDHIFYALLTMMNSNSTLCEIDASSLDAILAKKPIVVKNSSRGKLGKK